MSINISGIHFSITDPIRSNVEARINRLHSRYPMIKADVSLSKSHDDFTCVIDYHGDKLQASAQATLKYMYKAISVAADKIERQLNDQKEANKKKGLEGIKSLDFGIENDTIEGSGDK